MITRILNRIGLFTTEQLVTEQRRVLKAKEYVGYLEAALAKMPDEYRPIVVLGDNTVIRDIALSSRQQIIVSPYAQFTHISGVHTL